MKKEQLIIETGSGIFGGVFILTIILGIIFGFSPAIHYLEKWNSYWNEDSFVESTTNNNVSDLTNKYISLQEKAYLDCYDKFAEKYKNTTTKYWAFASSTSEVKDGFNTYKTYDCYANKYEKLN